MNSLIYELDDKHFVDNHSIRIFFDFFPLLLNIFGSSYSYRMVDGGS